MTTIQAALEEAQVSKYEDIVDDSEAEDEFDTTDDGDLDLEQSESVNNDIADSLVKDIVESTLLLPILLDS